MHRMFALVLVVHALMMQSLCAAAPGDWPEPRQNGCLTALQPQPGAMGTAPVLKASLDRGRIPLSIQTVAQTPEGPLGLAVYAGTLYCIKLDGQTAWTSHPAGLNFAQLVCAEDLDGDGVFEALLMAGRSAQPYGAAVLVSLKDGSVRWRYDVEPISYAWYLYADAYWPGAASKQIVTIMHGYPPDAKNGYIALFSFEKPGEAPAMRWRYDFSEYTCFPSFMKDDLDGDGTKELVVESHSRMWFLDAKSGALRDFVKWDVSPANMRSYGHIEFVDLNGDGRDDFFCIADFSQHHEVLLNRNGKLEKAWGHGWNQSVTTGQIASRFPLPPYGDLDGDGGKELVVSMFNADGKPEWMTRVYNAVTGEIKYTYPGLVATQVIDVNQDGRPELLGNRCAEATGTVFTGAAVLGFAEGGLKPLWENADLKSEKEQAKEALLLAGAEKKTLTWNGATFEVKPRTVPPAPQGPTFQGSPTVVGPAAPTLLAADLEGKGRNNLVVCTASKAEVFRLAGKDFEAVGEYASDTPPVLADVNGDGKVEVVTERVAQGAQPVIEAVTPALENRPLWKTTLPAPQRTGMPGQRNAYLRALKRADGGANVYAFAGLPQVHSAMLDGVTGAVLWDKDVTADSVRYWGPSINHASAWDFDGDGNEDLIFTNPDYYCVAEAKTGASLLGPLYPPEIFKQPSQGLYTCPVILEQSGAEPTVALVSGHYFQGVMSLHAAPAWYKLPTPGEARCNREAFLRNEKKEWLMGYGREDGQFVCVNVADGQPRWTYPAQATCSDVLAGDVDGDGRCEFVFATSHGQVVAVGDGGDAPRVVWTLDAGVGAYAPVLADLDGDGKVELVCITPDGWVRVYGGA